MPNGQAPPLKTYPPIPDELRIIFWSLGDGDKDGVIDKTDLNICASYFGKYNADYDFNGDGKVNIDDLSLCARNQGLTIETYWHNIVDREAMQDKLAEQTGVPNLPWYVDWIQPILEQQKTNLEAYAYWQQPAMQELVNGMKSLADLPANLSLGSQAAQKALYEYFRDSYTESLEEIQAGNMTNLPVPIQTLNDVLRANYNDNIKGLLDAVTLKNYATTIESDAAAFILSVEVQNKISEYLSNASFAVTMSKAAAAGDDYGAGDSISLVKSLTGAASLPAWINTYEMQKVLGAGMDRYFNTLWTPNIPAVNSFIKAYHQQQMTQNDFYKEMRRLGFSGTWADFLSKVDETPPSVADALKAWRRGKITEPDLERLFDVNGLDPEWHDVFDVRKYDDLSVGEARSFFSIGLIKKQKVFDTARRSGYDFDDATLLTEYVERFNESRLKLRYLLGVVTAASYNVISDAEIDAAATVEGWPATTAAWIKKVAGIKRAVLTRPKASAAKEKLLSLGDLKAAYLRGLLTEDVFRTELLTRGYSLDDITILISVMTDRRTVEQAGGKMYALSVIELLNAWRYNVISEDILRNKLLARGLPLDELDALIATKKVQWQITPQGA
jgi:hypothetical protein